MFDPKKTAVAMMLGALLAASPAAADPVADFYRGKTVEILIGAAAGGGYDLAGRAVARYLGRHIPGEPAIVVKNMPGSTSLRMTNYLYNVAARDGTAIGMPNNNIPFEPRLHMLSPDGKNIRFDVARLNWIGTPLQEPQVLYVWHTAPVKTVADLKKTEITVGTTAIASDNYTLPVLMNRLIGTRMKPVSGYQGQSGIFLALERGEVQGNSTGLSNLFVHKAQWMKQGKLRLLMQFAVERDPQIANIPTALELVSSDADRDLLRLYLSKYKMARPLAMPPGVPPERVATIRAAFDATMKDPAYIAEANKIHLDISPVDGAGIAALVHRIETAPQPMIDRLKALLARPGKKG
jgi:tripartite-type tricarboxylate transporter receptor subunit TctC